MMKRARIALGIVLFLCSCGSSPEPNYHVLTSLPGREDNLAIAVTVRRPALAAFLDRYDVVRQSEMTGIAMDDMQKWGAPPDRMIEDVFVENLGQRLPSAFVSSDENNVSAHANAVIETDIIHFNATDTGSELEARIYIKGTGGKTCIMPSVIDFLGTSLKADTAQGLSELLAQMSDSVIAALHASLKCSHDPASDVPAATQIDARIYK